jgi:hypothetical protein
MKWSALSLALLFANSLAVVDAERGHQRDVAAEPRDISDLAKPTQLSKKQTTYRDHPVKELPKDPKKDPKKKDKDPKKKEPKETTLHKRPVKGTTSKPNRQLANEPKEKKDPKDKKEKQKDKKKDKEEEKKKGKKKEAKERSAYVKPPVKGESNRQNSLPVRKLFKDKKEKSEKKDKQKDPKDKKKDKEEEKKKKEPKERSAYVKPPVKGESNRQNSLPVRQLSKDKKDKKDKKKDPKDKKDKKKEKRKEKEEEKKKGQKKEPKEKSRRVNRAPVKGLGKPVNRDSLPERRLLNSEDPKKKEPKDKKKDPKDKKKDDKKDKKKEPKERSRNQVETKPLTTFAQHTSVNASTTIQSNDACVIDPSEIAIKVSVETSFTAASA